MRQLRSGDPAKATYFEGLPPGYGDYVFLANDSSAVISRTGKWLTEWVEQLGSDGRGS